MTQRESDPTRHSAHLEGNFTRLLRHRPVLLAAEAAGPTACHLVGGALRDVALGLEFRDLDLVIERDGLSFARQVAATMPARLVELGGDRFAAFRLVADEMTVDIWDRQGAPIEADLARRDLTIHSFAVEISSEAIVDPFGGLVDLEDKVLRATSETSFSSDPLRVLRLARFAAQLSGFTVSEPTLLLATDSAAALARVAGERIRVELEHLFELPGFLSAAELLVHLTLYPGLWLPDRWHSTVIRDAEELIRRLRRLELLADHTRERVDRALARQAVLIAQLPLSAEQTATDTVECSQRNGLLTRATAKRLKRLLFWDVLPPDTAGQRWFLHRSGSLWPTAACVLAARVLGPCTLASYQEFLAQLDELCRASGAEIFEPEPLVTGAELVSNFGLQEGRMLGRILSTIQRRQIEGRLATRSEALALAKELALQIPDNKG